MLNTTNAWQLGESGFVNQIFNGSEASVGYIGQVIANGTWLTPWNETNSYTNYTSTTLPAIEKHMYGLMIPYAWAASTKSKERIMPIVVYVQSIPHREQ